jgi:hypothetical protein
VPGLPAEVADVEINVVVATDVTVADDDDPVRAPVPPAPSSSLAAANGATNRAKNAKEMTTRRSQTRRVDMDQTPRLIDDRRECRRPDVRDGQEDDLRH